jgi:hypothetical protein
MGETYCRYGGEERFMHCFVGRLEEDIGVGGRIILNRIFKIGIVERTVLIWLKLGTGGGLL